MSCHERRLEISEALVRAYSRRGNYHSEASTSDALGLPGLVAQGVQVAGPAYADFSRLGATTSSRVVSST